MNAAHHAQTLDERWRRLVTTMRREKEHQTARYGVFQEHALIFFKEGLENHWLTGEDAQRLLLLSFDEEVTE